MRYLESENPWIIGVFNTGDTVIIDILDLSDDSVKVNNGACAEVGGTGIFKYNFTTTPEVLTYYLYIMTNTVFEKYGIVIKGGLPDDINDKTKNLPASPATLAKQNTIITDVSNLNNLSSGQARSACDAAITANDEIKRITGLSRSNVVYDNFVFDGNHDETSRDAHLYDTKAHAQGHGDPWTGRLAKYSCVTAWTDGKPTKVTWTKEI